VLQGAELKRARSRLQHVEVERLGMG